jgi:hypothetical protein
MPSPAAADAQMIDGVQADEVVMVSAPYNKSSEQLPQQQGQFMLRGAEGQVSVMLQQLAAVQGLLIGQGAPYDHQQLEELSEELQQLLAASGPEHEQLLRQVLVQQQQLLAAQAGQLWAGVEQHQQQPEGSNSPNQVTGLVQAQQSVWPAAAAINMQPVHVQPRPQAQGSTDRTQAWVAQHQQDLMVADIQQNSVGSGASFAGSAVGYTGTVKARLEQTADTNTVALTPAKLAGVNRLAGLAGMPYPAPHNNSTAGQEGEVSLATKDNIHRPLWQQQGNSWSTHAPSYGMQATDAETLHEGLDDEAEYVRAVYGQAMAGSTSLVHYMMAPSGESSSGVLRQGPAQVTAVAQVTGWRQRYTCC